MVLMRIPKLLRLLITCSFSFHFVLCCRYGMVPNGGRVYYTNRSQPPLLPQMVDLVYSVTGDRAFLQRVLPLLVREYQFWMDQRSVMVQGHLMNRYAVDTDTPRPESYREDLNTASHLPEGEPKHKFILAMKMPC